MAASSYNGVTFPLIQTTTFSQVAERDQSQTDWYLVKFDITIQAFFNADVLPLMFPDIARTTDNAAAIMSAVRSLLLQHRKAFSFTMNGVELIPQRPAGNQGHCDAANGPQPQRCDVVSFNDVAFMVTWHVIASYWENTSREVVNGELTVSNLIGNPVLYNRWTETQDLDELMITRRTRAGKFVIRSDNSQGLIVDKFREQMAVVGIPKGFVRESASYTVDPSGLGLEYRLVDRQVFKMPPTPAMKATGDYTETTTRLGAMRHGEVYVRLEGSTETLQSELISAALTIGASKLQVNGAVMAVGFQDGKPVQVLAMIEHAQLRVGLWENWVELRIRSMMLPATDDQGKARTAPGKWWGINIAAMYFTPITDNEQRDMGNVNLIRGTAGTPANRMLLQAAAYYDPSLRNTKVDEKTGQLNAPGQKEVGQGGKNA